MAAVLNTKNLALNKVAQVLAYVEIEILSHQSQVCLRLFYYAFRAARP